MKTAFDVLDVAVNADDRVIKKAYLKQVKAFPPSTAPNEFREIQDAFNHLKTERTRAAYRLFHLPVLPEVMQGSDKENQNS